MVISDGKRLYIILQGEFSLTYWEIRYLLLHRLGFEKRSPVIRQTFKQARRRIREANEHTISMWVSQVKDMDPASQVAWIMRQAWPQDGAPVYEWTVVKDAIQRLNAISREGAGLRWNRVRRLRRFEVRSAQRKWEDQTIAAWLRLNGHVSVTEANYLESRDADVS